MRRLCLAVLACGIAVGCGAGARDLGPDASVPDPGPLDRDAGLVDDEACETPVAEDDVPLLAFGITEDYEMRAGSQHRFEVGVERCCVSWEAVPACARYAIEEAPAWSVGPARAFVSIEPDTGLATVAPHTPEGTVFFVVADVEIDRARVATLVFVRGEPSPIAGCWREVARLDCETDKHKAVGSDRIEELSLSEDGEFAVTWEPFEATVDYWGLYEAQDGRIELEIIDENIVPEGFVGEGNYELAADGSSLVLRGVDLGQRATDEAETRGIDLPSAHCGHVLEPSSTCLH